jgi:hypothetical protein
MFSYARLPPPLWLYDMGSPEGVNVATMKNTEIQRNEVDITTKHWKIPIPQLVMR